MNRLLDGIFGTGTWDLRFNKSGDTVRYWYAPVVFPEGDCIEEAGRNDESSSEDADKAECGPPRTAQLLSWREDFAKHGGRPPPPSSWSPVNRRRVRGKGWHVDLFPWDGNRQGVVCLLVLSDWRAGGGGTCFAEGSQNYVARRIVKAREPLSNDQINKMANEFLVSKARAGKMVLRSVDARRSRQGNGGSPEPEESESLANKLETEGKVLVSCVTARKGDVVLFHPWSVHSGTTNNRSSPRLMMNGMVRLREDRGQGTSPSRPEGALRGTGTEGGGGGTARRGANPLFSKTLNYVAKHENNEMCI